jgi:SNF2 family DNA or RNA helicase
MLENPDEIYRSYQKFLRKKEYQRAYRCLRKLLQEFPDDVQLLEDMVGLTISFWRKLDTGKPWLIRLAKIRSSWPYYTLLSSVEAELGNIATAKEYLKKSKELQKAQPQIRAERRPGQVFADLEGFIRYQEREALGKRIAQSLAIRVQPEKKAQINKVQHKSPQTAPTKTAEVPIVEKSKQKATAPAPATIVPIPTYRVPVKIEPLQDETRTSFFQQGMSPLKETLLFIDYTFLAIQGGFDELLCLSATSAVEKYWYQIETVKKVLKLFHGRALLCDEVGLGKTIEAGMVIKEYLMRGMVKNVLVLAPAPLVSQWQEEMQAKFGIEFLTTDDEEFTSDPTGFWKKRFIIASLNTAKSAKNMPLVTEQFYDLVVVDEAHHLKNRATLSWKLVNQLKKKFILLLTATPVQNNLIELFNLITILKPGQFKTEKQFKQDYLQKGSLKATADKDRLRALLRDVMIRNTRSAIDLKLPKRFAATMRLEPSETEQEIYARLDKFIRKRGFQKQTIYLLLREAGSSPFALKQTLLTMHGKDGADDIIKAIGDLSDIGKGMALMEILSKNPGEKKIIFTQFIKSMDYIAGLLQRHDVPFVMFRGDMSLKEKDAAIAAFRNNIPVLISTESGGEGRNLQFCNTIINFDLPWNPMRIEQRIGRLHRIGQTRDVFIFNLSVKDTIEDYIIEILDNKINMFEMVIGEIEPILGHLGWDREFEDIILELWQKSGRENLKEGFKQLGSDLVKAKQNYLYAKTADSEIFGEDYEM